MGKPGKVRPSRKKTTIITIMLVSDTQIRQASTTNFLVDSKICPVCGNADDRCKRGKSEKGKGFSGGSGNSESRNSGKDSFIQLCWNKRGAEGLPSHLRYVRPLNQGMGGLFIVYPELENVGLGERVPENVFRMARSSKPKAAARPATPEQVRIQSYVRWVQEQAKESEILAGQLLPADRDVEYRRLAEMMGGLSDRHLEKLLERGMALELTEFARKHFVSWWGTKEIPGGADPKLAGVSFDGKRSRSFAGLAIPAMTPTGKILGYQIMPDRTDLDVGKYIWLSSAGAEKGRPNSGGANPKLGTELPLYSWVHPSFPVSLLNGVSQIWICEGGIKSFLLAGYAWAQGWTDVAVVAAGGANQLATSPKILKRYLDALDPQHKALIRFFPDAGMISNEQVADAYCSFFQLITSMRQRENFEIAWWGQHDKKLHQDCDEMLFGGKISGQRIKVGGLVRLADGTITRVVGVKARETHDIEASQLKLLEVEWKSQKGFKESATVALRSVSAVSMPFEQIEWLTIDQYLSMHSVSFLNQVNLKFTFTPRKPGLRESKHRTQFPMMPVGPEGVNDVKQFYSNFDRLQVWQEIISDPEQRQRFVLDSSGTGQGKSHTAGQLDPADLNGYVSKVIYVTGDPLNVTTPTLSKDNGWAVLRGRDYGRKEVTVDGAIQLRRAEKGYTGDLALQSNCTRNSISELLASRQVPTTASNLCRTCPVRVSCLKESNDGLTQYDGKYGYLHDRKRALSSEKLIAHIASLEFDHLEPGETVALVIDEASQLPWMKTYRISGKDFPMGIMAAKVEVLKARLNARDGGGISDKSLEYLEAVLDRLEQEYKDRLSGRVQEVAIPGQEGEEGEEGKQGLIGKDALENGGAMPPVKLREMLLEIAGTEERAIELLEPFTPEYFEEQIQKHLEALNDQDEIDVDEAGDRREARRLRQANRSRVSTSYIESKLEEDLRFFWLPDLVAFLKGDKTVQVGLNRVGEPEVRKQNRELVELLKHPAVSTVLLLDATSEPQEFLDVLGEEVWHIRSEESQAALEVEQGSEHGGESVGADVEIVQVVGLGLLGRNRTESQEKNKREIISRLKKRHEGVVSTIDLKSFDMGEGIWYRDSRGSNAYQENEAIILAGAPIPNLSAVAGEYAIVNGYQPDTTTVIRSYPIDNVNHVSGDSYLTRDMYEVSDVGLAAEIRRRTLKAYDQAFGRLRANRRPGEKLTIYVISDYPLDRPVTIERANDLLGKKTAEQKIKEVIDQLTVEQIDKATSVQIAGMAGVSERTVRRSFAYKGYKKVSEGPDTESIIDQGVPEFRITKTLDVTGIQVKDQNGHGSLNTNKRGDVRPSIPGLSDRSVVAKISPIAPFAASMPIDMPIADQIIRIECGDHPNDSLPVSPVVCDGNSSHLGTPGKSTILDNLDMPYDRKDYYDERQDRGPVAPNIDYPVATPVPPAANPPVKSPRLITRSSLGLDGPVSDRLPVAQVSLSPVRAETSVQPEPGSVPDCNQDGGADSKNQDQQGQQESKQEKS